jgi:hypothetical protein
MAAMLKGEAWINGWQVFGGILSVASLVALFLNFRMAWLITVGGVILGLAVMSYGYWLSYRFDPHEGDPAPRIAEGQAKTVWGDNLTAALQEEDKPTDITDLFKDLFGDIIGTGKADGSQGEAGA